MKVPLHIPQDAETLSRRDASRILELYEHGLHVNPQGFRATPGLSRKRLKPHRGRGKKFTNSLQDRLFTLRMIERHGIVL